MSNAICGAFGEDIAVQYLQGKGYTILERNFFTNQGEVDVICQEIETKQIVFCEVKTSLVGKYTPEDNIDSRKVQKMWDAGVLFLQKKGIQTEYARCDALSIDLDQHKMTALIKHVKGICFF